MFIYIASFLLSFSISVLLTPAIKNIALKKGFVAKPKEDRWHKKETALFGGIAIFLSFLVPYVIFVKPTLENIGVIICAVSIFALGLFDDMVHIKPYTKLMGQIIVASLLVTFGVSIKVIASPIISMPLTVLWIVAIINAFNLLDNMDGLSSGVGAIVSGVLFLCAIFSSNFLVALTALMLAGSLLGFLKYNFSPAQIFMGDSGSMFIGFMVATMTLQESWRESTHLVMILAIPVLILAVPIFDTLFVTLARKVTSRGVFKGGKDHVSHRMVVLGFSEKKTVAVLYFISIFFGMISVVSMFVPPTVTLMLILLAAISLIYFAIFLGKVKVYEDEGIRNIKKKKNGGNVILNGALMHKRRILEVGVDFILICVAYISAYLLRFEGYLSLQNQNLIVKTLPLIVIIKYIVFFKSGLYRGIWRYVSVSDLIDIFKAVLLASAASILAVFFIWRFNGFSRAVFVIDWLLLFILISGSRILERIYKEIFDQASLEGRNVLIYGAGNAGEFVLREIKNNKLLQCKPIGFLDDNEDKVGKRIHGVPVLGSIKDMPKIIKTKNINEIIIAIPKVQKDVLDNMIKFCGRFNIDCRRMSDVLPK